MFSVLFKKELWELARTAKLAIYLAVFFVSGLISPLLARYTPELLKAVPDMPSELVAIIPTPTVNDAVAQYIKNTSQFGVLLVILLTMTVLAQEKERGTAAMLLTKPVRRSAVVLAKWLAGHGALAAGLAVAALGCLGYTAVLFELLPIGSFLLLNGLLLVYFSVHLSVALLASALARSQSIAAIGAFGGLAMLLIVGALPRLSDYLPGALLTWGGSLLAGGDKSAWPALWVSLGLILGCVALACIYFEREEI
jgi:ABC-2 type transport system permease protein